jgi:[citrate (pro-3S)-lyase] ligase
LNIDKINFSNLKEVEEVQEFLKRFELQYDSSVDYTIVAREGAKVVATASKGKNIVKCFAIDNQYQGEGLSTQLLTNLINKMFDEGYFHSLIFTKLSNKELFRGMGYKEVAHTDKVILMEMGNKSIKKTLEKIIKKYDIDTNKKRAMIVMNCNPFTLGHQYLIEKVANENDEVLVFIVEEDRSSFPFKVRYELVQKGTAHLKNVKVIPGTEYIISSATFPNYFLRKEDDSLIEYTKLDASVCGEQFGKILNINRRYVGDEPFCKVTNLYNNALKEILPQYGIEVIIVPRKEIENIAVSASKVRELLKEENYEEIKKIVPPTTYEFLISPQGKEIGEKLKASNSPH